MKKYFYCYSYPLKEFLRNNGLRFVVNGIHPSSNKKYWVYERENNKKLDNLLTEWKLRKK